MLTAKARMWTASLASKSAADDYSANHSSRELLARVHAVLRVGRAGGAALLDDNERQFRPLQF